MDPAEKRYDELKEEAKEEFINKKRRKAQEDEEDQEDMEDKIEEEKEDGFVTY
jgi:hypothetical protein